MKQLDELRNFRLLAEFKDGSTKTINVVAHNAAEAIRFALDDGEFTQCVSIEVVARCKVSGND